MEMAKLDALGRVVVPARLRRATGLRAGMPLRAERSGEGILLTPVRDSPVLQMATENPIRLGRRVARSLTVERMEEIAEEAFAEDGLLGWKPGGRHRRRAAPAMGNRRSRKA